MTYEFKDSGQRQSFATGAVRDTQDGKGRFDLICWEFLRRLAVVMQKGAGKYGPWNWAKGIPLSRSFDSAVRHMYQWAEGKADEDHLAHAAANLMFLICTEAWVLNQNLPADLADLGPHKNWAELLASFSTYGPTEEGADV